MSFTISYDGPMRTKEPDIQELFSTRLRKLRRQRKISQEALAAKAGCDISTLGRTERGEVSPTLRMMERFAKALGCTLLELVDFSEQRGNDDATARLKEQIHVLSTEGDSQTLDLASLVLADFIHHGRKHRTH